MPLAHHTFHGTCQRNRSTRVFQNAANERAEDNHQCDAAGDATKSLAYHIGDVGKGHTQQQCEQQCRAQYRQERVNLEPRDSYYHQDNSRSKQ